MPKEGIQSGSQLSFVEFLIYFHVCRRLKRTKIGLHEAADGINELRFGQKDRCLVQHLCSNKHLALLEELVASKSSLPFSKLINREISLNTMDI